MNEDTSPTNEGFVAESNAFTVIEEKKVVPEHLDDQQKYESAILSCGFGNFQVILLLVSGWALASDSIEVQVI